MKQDNNLQAFYALIRAGLWENDVQLSPFGKVDYSEVLRLAEEQSVVGLVAAGFDHVTDVRAPQETVLQFVGSTLQLERQNGAMNQFIGKLVDKMRNADIYTLLVKGQGVAQCYERPLWRACGDVDLLLSEDNYEKAKVYLKPMASSVEDEDKKRKHLGLVIDNWVVELHGTLHTRQLTRLNKVVDDVQKDVFLGGNVRSWQNGGTQVFLPSADNDVIFVFAHILQHYFGGGIGLRQICDWCRLLWTYKVTLNHELLESRIRRAGVMTEWKAFAALAVEYLGMPAEAMPLYSPSAKWRRKAEMIVSFIMKNGSFGHNRDNGYRNGSAFEQKMGSLRRYTVDTIEHLRQFPIDSIKVLGRMVWGGITEVLR